MNGSVIGIDLGGTKIRGGRISAAGAIEERREVHTDRSSGAAVIGQLAELAAALRTPTTTALGIGVPGTIQQHSGSLIQAANLPLGDVPLRERIAALTGLRVEIDNDANCAALGEHAQGAGAGSSNSITLTLGTGVGGGIVIDDRVFRGATGAGAELGHIVIEADGRPCQGSCNGRGHLEAYCSGSAVRATAAALAAEKPDGSLAAVLRDGAYPSSQMVVTMARAGNEDALAVIEQTARWLGAGLVSLANAFEPEVFIIGGGFGAAAADLLLPVAAERLRSEALRPNRDAAVVAARLGNDAGMVGAAELVRV